MGKLDESLLKIKAHAHASRQGPDISVEPRSAPEFVSEIPTSQVTQEKLSKPKQILGQEDFQSDFSAESFVDSEPTLKKTSEPLPKEHRSVHFSPNVSVTQHSCLLEAVNEVASFHWHPHIEVCRTQTNAFEEFKKLRTNVVNLMDRRQVKTFMITSCKHAEGKTTTALALARSLADLGGPRICLVDGDMRRPRVKNFLNLKVEKGLDDVILGEVDLAEALVYSKKDHFTVLPTRKGRSIASELLGSQQMGAIVRLLCRDFDLVLFDSPPCLSTTDPIVLGSLMDAVSLTVKMNHTPRQSVEHSIALMHQSEIPFVGLILTHHVVHYNTYLLQKYNYYQDYYGYYAYQDSENT